MTAIIGGVSRFEHSAFVWSPLFEEQRIRSYAIEGKAAVESERFDTSTLLTGPIILGRFLNYACDGDTARYLYRNVPIETFLQDISLECLQQGLTRDVLAPTVLVDDRRKSESPTSGTPNVHSSKRDALHAHAFYNLLRKSVIKDPLTSTAQLTSDQRYHVPSGGQFSAQIRTIYIADADPYCILALLATVCAYQAVFLRDFIWRNLTFDAFLSVKIPSHGFKTFALEFHLPYYAWRRKMPDKRGSKCASRTHRLRQSQEVKYLFGQQGKRNGNCFQEQIFEAQLSILVTGIDNLFWTAYCFADVYFKDFHHSESAEHYYSKNRESHSGGKDAAGQILWDAREFFLRVLACRMQQVKEEWNNVVAQLLQQIEPYADKILEEASRAALSGEQDITQTEGYRWTIGILRKYANHLSKTVDKWEAFKQGEIRYFYKPNSNELADLSYGGHLAAVNKEVERLIELQKSLQHQTEIFENMTNSMSTQAATAESRTLRRQSDYIKALTIITIFYLPLTLSTGIYSMQPAMLPASVQIKHYIYTLLGLTIATLILVINLPYMVTFWRAFRTTPGYMLKFFVGIFDVCAGWIIALNKRIRIKDKDNTVVEEVEMTNGVPEVVMGLENV